MFYIKITTIKDQRETEIRGFLLTVTHPEEEGADYHVVADPTKDPLGLPQVLGDLILTIAENNDNAAFEIEWDQLS